jgi:putative salt-induced outer membrane protein YdiY
MFASCLLAPLIAMGASLPPLPADEIFLKNGDRISGKIVSMADEKLVVDTGGTAGQVTLAWKEIKTINSDAPVKVLLKDGTSMERLLASTDGGAVLLKGGDVELPAIRLDQFDKINPPPTDVSWQGDISIGANKTMGNSESQSISAGGELVRRSLLDRLTVSVGWFYSDQTNTVPDPANPGGTTEVTTISDRRTFGAMKYDYFLSKKWYINANTKAENSKAANLELRYTVGGGLGYQVSETDTFKFSVEAGLVYFWEDFKNPDAKSDYVAARVANNMDLTILTGISYLHLVEWFPSLEDGDDQLVHYDGKLRATLTESMFAQFNVVWDWDNTPAAGKKRNDERLVLAVGWKI